MGIEPVHADLPVVDRAYFANVAPEAMALITEGLMLGHRTGTRAGMPSGVLWAALRAVERGEAACPSLAVVSSCDFERHHVNIYSALDLAELTTEIVESYAVASPHVFLPGAPCRGGECPVEENVFNSDGPITVGAVLAGIIAKFDFHTAANAVWGIAGHDVREIHEQLLAERGFVAGEALKARGRVLPDKQALYEKACELAASRGMWFLRGFDVEMAAIELGISTRTSAEQEVVRQRYRESVEAVLSEFDSGGCVAIYCFPGPRPWAPSAADLLGVEVAGKDEILAPWPTKDDVPDLIEQLAGDDCDARWWAIVRLQRLEADAAAAVEPLAALLSDGDSAIRCQAVRAMRAIGPAALRALDALIDAVDDEDQETATVAAGALGVFGVDAAAAADKLTKVWRDTERKGDLRSSALSALAHVAPDAPATHTAILEAMDEQEKFVQMAAMRALGVCDPLPDEAMPKLIEALRGEDRDLQGWAAETLVLLGPAGVGAVAALVEVLKDPTRLEERGNPYRRWRAAEALGEIGPAAEDAVPALIEAADDSDGAVSAYAALALGKIGPKAAAAMPLLIEKLKAPDISHAHLAKALGHMGSTAESAVPHLLALLNGGKGGERAEAALALGRISRSDEVAAAVVAAVRTDADPHVRLHAAMALTDMGPEVVDDLTETVQPVFDEALGGDDDSRALAAYGLVRLGRADEGLSVLTDVLQQDGERAYQGRCTAAELLGWLGPIANSAAPLLLQAARGQDFLVVQRARSALNRVQPRA